MKFLAALVGALFIATTAYATPASQASIDKLMAVTNARKIVENIPRQVDRLLANNLNQQADKANLPADAREVLESFRHKVIANLKNDMAWDKLSPSYAKLYSEVFTEEEIRQLITFYESPTGKMLTEKMPLVTQKSLIMTQQLMQGEMQKISVAYKEALQEAEAKKK